MLAQRRAQQTDQPSPHAHQMPPHAHRVPQLARRGAHTMRAPIQTQPARRGQRRHISLVGLDPARAVPVHRRVIGIHHDHLVSHRLEMLGHPLTLRAALQQNPHPRAHRKHAVEIRPRGVDPAIEHDLAGLIENADLAATEMEIDGTIFHGWLLLCALSASNPCAAQASTSQGQPAASSHLLSGTPSSRRHAFRRCREPGNHRLICDQPEAFSRTSEPARTGTRVSNRWRALEHPGKADCDTAHLVSDTDRLLGLPRLDVKSHAVLACNKAVC